MDADKTTLHQLLNGEKQFCIPIYQRTYSWRQEQCERLIADIIQAARGPEGTSHFLGPVVYVTQSEYLAAGVNPMLLIDGQQRMTTLSLLILAIRRYTQEKALDVGASAEVLGNRYLFNRDEDPARDAHFKLLLTRSDKTTYLKICREIPLDASDDNRVKTNYQYFLQLFENGKYEPQEAYVGIQRLLLVFIALERGKDNPQLIFESMNSTGLDLAQADLIRNYVLMGLPNDLQNRLYEQHWYPMEQLFGQQYKDRFDSFMRTYLTVRAGTIPRESEVYAAFKKYLSGKEATHPDGVHTMEKIADDLYNMATRYANIVFQREPDPALRHAFHDFAVLRAEVAHPFFLELYADYNAGLLTAEELLRVVRLTESYVFRRSLCGIPTNSMNKTFATFLKKVDKARYFKSLQAEFLRLDRYRRFPADVEVQNMLQERDVYNFERCAYLLERLENSHRPKEPIRAASYTIEHIMPQTLLQDWQTALGPEWQAIYERYLHTLGNLTLTGYNSELSCRPFREKLDLPEGGFKTSPLALNRFVAQQTNWGKEQIEARGKELSPKVCSVWNYPDTSVLNEFMLAPVEELEHYSLDHYEHLRGEMLNLYGQFEQRVLALYPGIRREHKKLYIAFKLDTNFVDVVPQASRLRLSLNLAFDQIDDPRGWCKDVTDRGRWGNGDVEVGLQNVDQLDYIMGLVSQALEAQSQE